MRLVDVLPRQPVDGAEGGVGRAASHVDVAERPPVYVQVVVVVVVVAVVDRVVGVVVLVCGRACRALGVGGLCGVCGFDVFGGDGGGDGGTAWATLRESASLLSRSLRMASAVGLLGQSAFQWFPPQWRQGPKPAVHAGRSLRAAALRESVGLVSARALAAKAVASSAALRELSQAVRIETISWRIWRGVISSSV